MYQTWAAMMRYTGTATLELLDRVARGGFKGTVEKAGMALETKYPKLREEKIQATTPHYSSKHPSDPKDVITVSYHTGRGTRLVSIHAHNDEWWDCTKWVEGHWWSDEYQKWCACYNGQWYYWYSYKSVRRESLTCPALPTPEMKLILAMASAMVKGFFLFHDYKFQEAIQEIPDFAMDLLAAVKVTSQTIAYGEYCAEFKESLSGEILAL